LGFPLNLDVVSVASRVENIALAEVRHLQGRAALCQYNLVDNLETDPGARQLLANILNHYQLSDRKTLAKLSVIGNKSASLFAQIINEEPLKVNSSNISEADHANPLIVGSETVLDENLLLQIVSFAEKGGSVLLMPREKTFSIAGKEFILKKSPDKFPANSIGPVQNPWIFKGMNMYELINRHSAVLNHYIQSPLPEGVHGLATAFWTYVHPKKVMICTIPDKEPYGWAAAGFKVAKGRIIICQLPFDSQTPKMIYAAGQILSNLGVCIKQKKGRSNLVKCLQARDMKIDGKLNDWTSDNTDTNVAIWRHAVPIVLDSMTELVNKGQTGDQDSSGVAYSMYDKDYFYIAGVFIDDYLNFPEKRRPSWQYDSVQFFVGSKQVFFAIKKNLKPDFYIGGRGLKITREQLNTCKVIVKKIDDMRNNPDIRLLGSKLPLLKAPGYLIEAAIPIKLLFEDDSFGPGKIFKFAIAVNDNDNGKQRQGQRAFPVGWKYRAFGTYAIGIFEK